MDRSLFPENVEVRSPDLRFDSEQQAFHILSRFRDACETGVASGLVVTANSTAPSTLDVSAGRGYTPSGELVELSTAALQVPLADAGAGAVNFVCVQYGETLTLPGPDELSAQTRLRRVVRTSTLRVFTQIAYGLLAQTSSDPSVTTRDNLLVIAIVQGAGVGGNLSENIVSATSLSVVYGCDQPGNGLLLIGLSGYDSFPVLSTGAVDNGSIGTATLTYTFDGTNDRLSWAALGEPAGTPVVLSAAGFGQVVLQSSTTTRQVTVRYYRPALPKVASLVISGIDIYRLYEPVTRRTSGADELHRRLVNNDMLPSPVDPHGVSFASRMLEVDSVLVGRSRGGAGRFIAVVPDGGAAAPAPGTWALTFVAGGDNGTIPTYREYVARSADWTRYARVYNAFLSGLFWYRDIAGRNSVMEVFESQTGGSARVERKFRSQGDFDGWADSVWTIVERTTLTLSEVLTALQAASLTVVGATSVANLTSTGNITANAAAPNGIITARQLVAPTADIDTLTGPVLLSGDTTVSGNLTVGPTFTLTAGPAELGDVEVTSVRVPGAVYQRVLMASSFTFSTGVRTVNGELTLGLGETSIYDISSLLPFGARIVSVNVYASSTAFDIVFGRTTVLQAPTGGSLIPGTETSLVGATGLNWVPSSPSLMNVDGASRLTMSIVNATTTLRTIQVFFELLQGVISQ